jgi:hypothetical protein
MRLHPVDPPPPDVEAAMYPNEANDSSTNQTQSLGSNSTQLIVDSQVAPAMHQAPKNDLEPIKRMLDSLPNNVPKTDRLTAGNPFASDAQSTSPAASESGDSDASATPLNRKFDREKFQALIRQLAINTGIVMCIGIGFIVVAKQYVNSKQPHSKKKTETPIEIKSTLKLSPKSNLHLIEAGDHRLIVAMDQNGIKSVVKLTDSFAGTLDSFEDLITDETSDTSTLPTESAKAGTYSLATVGQAVASSPKSTKTTPAVNEHDEIRRKMEAALCDHGLKDLILESLKKG